MPHETILFCNSMLGIIFQFQPKEKFLQFKEYSHQGVIAYVSPVKYVEFEALVKHFNRDTVQVVCVWNLKVKAPMQEVQD